MQKNPGKQSRRFHLVLKATYPNQKKTLPQRGRENKVEDLTPIQTSGLSRLRITLHCASRAQG